MRKVFLSLILSFLMLEISACDICSCNANDLGLGIAGSYAGSQVMMAYSNSRFQSLQEQNETVDLFSYAELSTQFKLGANGFLRLKLPFSYNQRIARDFFHEERGMGDPYLGYAHKVLNKSLKNGLELQSMLNLGVHFPFGSFDEHIHDLSVPESFNPGRGLFALAGSWSGLVEFHNWSFNATYAYRHFIPEEGKYCFGDQQIFAAQLFWRKDLKHVVLKPLLGFQRDFINSDTNPKGIRQSATGANGAALNFGVFLRKDSWLMGCNALTPIQYQSNNNFNPAATFQVQLTYLFKNEKLN